MSAPQAARHLQGILLLLLLACVPSVTAAEALRVGTITIRNGDVFSEGEAAHGAVYRFADKLHPVTRPDVIRKFLLFNEGDPYDPARLAETERSLRALRFLRGATVKAQPPHDGVVDVIVSTYDAWSIEPGTDAGSSGGVHTFGLDLTDSNLAGSGRQISISYHQGVDRRRAAIDFADPAFLRPYWRARVMFAQNSDGFERRIAYGQPFYSSTTHHSTEVSVEDYRRDDRLFDSGIETATLRQDHRQFIIGYGIATESSEESATRWSVGTRLVHDQLLNARSFERVDDRDYRYVFLRFDRVNNDFIKRNYIDEDLRYQDFNLGRQVSLETAISPAALGAARTTEFARGAVSQGAAIDAASFILGTMSAEARLDRGVQNGILSGSARYIRTFDSRVPQTFVARAMFEGGRNLDPEVQFFADGGTGLRGYRLHTFAGSRALVVNAEQRLYLGREVLQLASPGLVVFADAGKATSGSMWNGAGFKSDVGVGLRIGLPRAPRTVLRIDFAQPLQNDPLGRRRPVISFSSGQGF